MADTGFKVHVQQLTSALMKRGHSILAYRSWDENPDFIYYRRRQFFKFIKDIDIVYIRLSGNMEDYTLLKLFKPLGLPVVWELNAPLEEAAVRDKMPQEKIKKAFKKRKRLAKLVDACICVSDELKSYCIDRLGIKNTFVIENGSNPELFSFNKKTLNIYDTFKDRFKIVWTGRMRSPWHGIDIILDVAKRIQAIDKDIVFIIIGDTKGMDLALPENIVLVDQIEYFKLPAYVASCDMGLALYHGIRPIEGDEFYGSSLKLFDYMSCRLPVIATSFGQIKKVIKNDENGLLTDNNPDDIIQKILRLKRSPEYSKRLGGAARKQIVDYYNWDRAAKQTEEALSSLC